MENASLRIRIPATAKAWLESRAEDNGRTMNGELNQILKGIMNAEPLYVVVRKCVQGSTEFFTAALGESTDDFYEGTEAGAYEAAREKLKSLGFDRANIEYREEKLN